MLRTPNAPPDLQALTAYCCARHLSAVAGSVLRRAATCLLSAAFACAKGSTVTASRCEQARRQLLSSTDRAAYCTAQVRRQGHSHSACFGISCQRNQCAVRQRV